MNQEELRSWIRDAGSLQFSRSTGPGGQNVNKLNTRVSLTVPLTKIPGLTESELQHLQNQLGGRVNGSGELQIHSQESRSQLRNREIAEERALALILGALKPRRKRIKTRPGAAARHRRIQGKKVRGAIKKMRKPPNGEDLG